MGESFSPRWDVFDLLYFCNANFVGDAVMEDFELDVLDGVT